jgi:antitoxin component YwqK of YwqJK toxin-antitoxin module
VEHDEKGRITERAPYRRDKLDGEVLRFGRNGKLREKQVFKDGKPVSEPIEYDADGRTAAKARR